MNARLDPPRDGRLTTARIVVIVVTFNNAELIERCLDAIDAAIVAHPYEVVVVDNASSDDTVERVRRRGAEVRCMALEENLGFAAANNIGIAASDAPYLALVNSDAFPDPGSIDRLVDRLEEDRSIGIAGACLRWPSGSPQPSAGRFPSLRGNLWIACFFHRLPGVSRLGLGLYAHPSLYRRARPVDWVTGALCVARREVGPLPERSFMYGEDVEWAAAALAAGYATWIEPAAAGVHIANATVKSTQETGFKQVRRVEFELGWFRSRGRACMLALRAILALHAVLRLALYGLVHLVRPQAARQGIAEFMVLLRCSLRAP